MRRCLFGLGLLLPLFFGCSAENIVAGEEKTKAEQLESSLPAWCPSVCERLGACPQGSGCDCEGDVCDCVGIDENCEEQCNKSFERFVDAGEFCADVGQRLKACIDSLSCEDLSGSDPCRPTDAENRACPDPHDGDDETPPSAVGGPVISGPSGSTPMQDNPGSSAGANPVTCTASSGSGGGAPDGGGAQVTCEEERANCSNGHVYSWICSQDSQGQRACACLVDSQATASFVPNSSDCPLLAQVNTGCAWALTQ